MISRRFALVMALAMLAACDSAAPEDSAEDVAAAGEDVAMAEPADAGDAEEITCTWPVERSDTAETLAARFGDDARVETLYGPEGIEMPGIVLWPDDEARKVEVMFEDESRSRVIAMRLLDGTDWTIAGLAPGDNIGTATEANGTAFELFGFEWDYGGQSTDMRGGTLSSLGECTVFLSFAPSMETVLPVELLGDVILRSDDPRIPHDDVVLWEIGLGYIGE